LHGGADGGQRLPKRRQMTELGSVACRIPAVVISVLLTTAMIAADGLDVAVC